MGSRVRWPDEAEEVICGEVMTRACGCFSSNTTCRPVPGAARQRPPGAWRRPRAGNVGGASQIRYVQRIVAPQERRCLRLFQDPPRTPSAASTTSPSSR